MSKNVAVIYKGAVSSLIVSSYQVTSIKMAQTCWMLDLLLLMVPDHSEDQSQEQEHQYITNISLQKLSEDAKVLAEKMDYLSRYITRYQMLYTFLQFTDGQVNWLSYNLIKLKSAVITQRHTEMKWRLKYV